MHKSFIACIAALSLTGCLNVTEQIAGPPPPDAGPVVTCKAKTCADLKASCGAPDDGCGHTLGCGVCGYGLTCSSTRSCVPTQIVGGTCSQDGFCLESGQLTAETLRGIHGIDKERAWAVGDNGTILRRTQAGWQRVMLPAAVHPKTGLTAVRGFGSGDVWIVGEKGTVLRHSEQAIGGWVNLSIPGGIPTLHTVFGSSSSNVYIAGEGVLFHFDGNALTGQVGPTNVSFIDGAVLPDGRVAGLSTDALWVREANSTWVEHAIRHSKQRLSVCPDGDVALFGSYSGETGDIQRIDTTQWTEAGSSSGSTWFVDGVCTATGTIWSVSTNGLAEVGKEPFLPLPQNHFTAIDATSDGTIWAAGASGVVYQVDSGGKLERMHGPLNEDRSYLTGSSRSNVWLFGARGNAERFDGSSWSALSYAEIPGIDLNRYDVTIQGVAVEPNRLALVVGHRDAQLAAVSYDGTDWRKELLQLPLDTYPVGIGRLGSSVVFVHRDFPGGDFGTLVQNGETWAPMQAPTPFLSSVSSNDELVAVSPHVGNTSSNLYQWTPAGWVVLSSTLPTVTDTWLNGTIGYAATAAGVFTRSPTGWTLDSRLPPDPFVAVQGTSEHDIWALGHTSLTSAAYESQLFHFDGTSWTPVDLGVSLQMRALYVSSTDIWVLANGGVLLHKAR